MSEPNLFGVPYRDVHENDEDTRIGMIGNKAMQGGRIAFITDDEPDKPERYVRKLLKRFPELEVVAGPEKGPTPGAVTVAVQLKGK